MTELMETFYLGDWYVDVGANRLYRDDMEIKLEAKVMVVLGYLAQHRGEIVPRETLERNIWGDTVVGYDALTSCIAKLRKILDDDPRHPRYIETISKKGYRLIGDVTLNIIETTYTQEPNTADHSRSIAKWRIGTVGLVILIAGLVLMALSPPSDDIKTVSIPRVGPLPSLVVLPFTNIAGQTGQDYFSEGITADITTALSKLSGLFVITKGTNFSVQHVAPPRSVRYVLSGSVLHFGNRLRVNVHLVDVTRDIYLWSEKYDREIHNVFDILDDISANIVNSLSITLTEEDKRLKALRYTTSIEAYDDFLRGRSLFNRNTHEDNLSAREYYQRAIDRDSNFARAYSSMAMTYVHTHRYGWEQNSTKPLDKALSLAKRGVALDEELPHTYWVLANVNLYMQEYKKAAAYALRAIGLDPNFTDSYVTLAVCKMHFGEHEEALRLIRKAMILNPNHPAAYASILGQIHFFLGEYEDAVPILLEAVELNLNLLEPHTFLIVALSILERHDEAEWRAEQLRIIAPLFTTDNMHHILPLYDADVVKEMIKHLRRFGF